MVNYDDFKNTTEQQMDELFQYGTDLAVKYGEAAPLALAKDAAFATTLGYLFLAFASYNAAAMLASQQVGIETTANPLRVMLAYISTDESFLDQMTDKAERTARTLSLRAWTGTI